MASEAVIGIIGCVKPLEGETAHTIKVRYLDAVRAHSGLAAVIIPSLEDSSDIAAIVSRLDGILLTGSTSNMEPHNFGGRNGREPRDPARDATALALIAAAQEAKIPVVGICRGFQEINVALGGTLADQRDAEAPNIAHHASDDATLEEMFAHSHQIDVSPGSRLEQITQAKKLLVNSVHYQTIDRLGDNLRVEATSADGVVEAISSRDDHSLFAVQWHPEWRPETRPHDLAFWHHLGEIVRNKDA